MVAPRTQIPVVADAETYPLGENSEYSNGSALALLALSHTAVEHRIYLAMLAASNGTGVSAPFSGRRLMQLTDIGSLSTIRRGLDGLTAKLSIRRELKKHSESVREPGNCYRVFRPEEIIERHRENGGMYTSVAGLQGRGTQSFERAITRVADNQNLSRREAQVALCCVQGLTNAEIGLRLRVSEQTVKFHLRHVFIKFGVRRRAELIARLLM
jgi:DNA-binding CsgD family transcriptional regulator